ncbi:MAG TPA: ATP-binding protein [Balneolaceae bacterium]|nr:ATP-binding protein [Balneolaceae bacterium]
MATRNSTYTTMTVRASTDYLADVRDFVAKQAASFGFGKEEISDIRLAVDEAFTNIIKHAYQNDEKQSVKISLGKNGDAFWISLLDTGRSFSLQNYEEPDVKERVRQKKRGGVGVYLIRKLMDDVSYRHEGTKNEIRMVKKR